MITTERTKINWDPLGSSYQIMLDSEVVSEVKEFFDKDRSDEQLEKISNVVRKIASKKTSWVE